MFNNCQWATKYEIRFQIFVESGDDNDDERYNDDNEDDDEDDHEDDDNENYSVGIL